MMLNKSIRTTCRLLPLLMVAVMLSACVNTLELAVPKSSERVGVTHEGAVANAKAYFDTHFGFNTRSNDQTPTPDAPYVVGNLVPDWESGVTVASERKSYTDFAMQKDYHYFLLLGEEESEQMQAVELYSRFVSVEDVVDGTMSQYVATYIPDEEYLNSYGAVAQDYGINCAEWYEFSGVVLYTLPHGHHVAAYRYKEGELVAGSFLYDSEQTTEQNIADFMAVTEGIRVSVGELSEGTRSDVLYGGTIEEIVIVYDTGFPIFIIDNTDIWETGNRLIEPFDNFHIVLGGGGGGTTTTEEEDEEDEDFEKKLVEDLFDTSNLSDDKVKEVGKMLMEIIQDCMGGELYNKLVKTCEDDGQLSIIFASSGAVPSYKNTTRTITITDNYSDTLLHEMFHAYQDVMIDSDLSTISTNLEIEAQVAKYKYAYREGSPISEERINSEYRDDDMEESFYSIHCATTEDASAKPDLIDNFYTLYEKAVEEIMAKSDLLHLGYQFDAERSMVDNWSNIIELSIKCK